MGKASRLKPWAKLRKRPLFGKEGPLCGGISFFLMRGRHDLLAPTNDRVVVYLVALLF